MTTIAKAGNSGKRSDCEVIISVTGNEHNEIFLRSKVMTLYGKSIQRLLEDILLFYDLHGLRIEIDDQGALEWVIAARTEAALRQLFTLNKAYMPVSAHPVITATDKDRDRVSRLYLPGNSPWLMLNAAIHKPDGIILDLEDSVAPGKKAEAAVLVRNALLSLDFMRAEKMVRINQLPLGFNDLDLVMAAVPQLILLPKCEKATQVLQTMQHIDMLRAKHRIEQPVWLMPIIESALGVQHAFEIAKASPAVVGLAIGLEDYTADLGVQRTPQGWESLYACSAIVNACKAVGIQANDAVFADVMDAEGLKANIIRSKMLGFEGMGCIHPRQIAIIHKGYAPEEAEIEKAAKIVTAFEEAVANGHGVVALGSKMVDLPVVKRAQKIMATAKARGLLDKTDDNGNQ